tara:strand:- start:47 stop:622 length:576 start_codon:yes stop_codon:yes gene_type:complete
MMSDKEIKGYNKILKRLNISHIELERDPDNHFHQQLFNEMNNENMFFLIIKNMSLGIIMNRNTAFRFDYIKNIVNEYCSYKTIFKYKIKIIELDEKWDTFNWNYEKLRKFHFMNSDMSRFSKTLDFYKKNQRSPMYSSIDVCFLEALSWTTPEYCVSKIEDSSRPIQTTINNDLEYFNNETYLEPMPYIID